MTKCSRMLTKRPSPNTIGGMFRLFTTQVSSGIVSPSEISLQRSVDWKYVETCVLPNALTLVPKMHWGLGCGAPIDAQIN